MQATFNITVENFTPDFADGIRKVFPGNTLLKIALVQTNTSPANDQPKAKRKYTKRVKPVEGKKRGRKAGKKS